MNNYFSYIKNTIPYIQEADLLVPVKTARIDSIDLVIIRVTLEKLLGKEIPNNQWSEFKTIQQAIEYCKINTLDNLKLERKIFPVKLKRKCNIGMPQMANSAVSENWLFKELGDIHWELLTKGLNCTSSNIKDETGTRLYATFTRIRISSVPITSLKENDPVHFEGEIKRFGLSTYFSDITFQNNNDLSKATLMTSFSTRESIDNSKLFKSQPGATNNLIPEELSTPEFLNDYRLLRKNLINTISLGKHEFIIHDKYLAQLNYKINPYYDINGVGLLYFASYPTISDTCEAEYFNSNYEFEKWENTFYTSERDIFYFANCNSNDSIVYQVNSVEFIGKNIVKIFSSLYRAGDMMLMAHIFSIKKSTI